MQRPSIRRVLGRAAVGTLLVSAAAVPLGAGTAQAAPAWSVSTDAPGVGLIAIPGGGYHANVPYNICSVEWTLIGGQGGEGSGGVAAGAGGELRVTMSGTAGQGFSLYPGSAGRAWADGGAGGTNGVDAAGQPGAADGGGGGGGGGGAGSAVRAGGGLMLGASGGTGGGPTGGAGGTTTYAGPSGNTVVGSMGGPLSSGVPTFDGRTSDVGASGRTGAGVISAVGTLCPASPPGAPNVIMAGSYGEDGAIRLVFQPTAPQAHQVWSPVTGWEVTVDGGSTWRPLPASALPTDFFSPGTPTDGMLLAFVRGLANGDHPVAVRATSAAGPGVATPVRTVRLVGTPTNVTATDVSVTAGVSSLRVSWTPPVGPVYGGYVAESYDAAQDGEGVPFALCETTLDVHSCVLPAEPGRSYRVVVGAGGGRTSAPVTSGVVAAPPVPDRVPASSGALQVPAGSSLRPGAAVDVAGAGYLAGSTVTVVVYSTPTVLDSLVTKADGSFATSVTLPSSLPAGAHTLVATGVGPDGQTWTLTQAITAGTGGAPGGATARALAYTGADVAVPLVSGVLALMVGAGLLLAGRRVARRG